MAAGRITAGLRAATLCVGIFAAAGLYPASAQDTSPEAPKAKITADRPVGQDVAVERRLRAIFGEIAALKGVAATAKEGVVILSGSVANEASAGRAVALASRIEGVVEVEDRITRTLDVEENLDPLLERTEHTFNAVRNAWPLYAIALAAFILVAAAGHLLASAHRFWQFVAPNPFIARLISQSIRIVGAVAGLLLALSILDAMALFGAAAGGAGLIGLAVGFAVKDTIENYIASVMLSLRQPFRADDHVIINDLEGIVVRLTSRATILMTLDGNHLRIPNADVFKGVILNYTRNPHRRLAFKLGVDADDDPIEALSSGLEAMRTLDFLLSEPQPAAYVEEVGDSNIVIVFTGWIDQRQTDFAKARSAVINVVKTELETGGFTLPEPIYRVRLEGLPAAEPPLRIAPDTGKAPKAEPEPEPAAMPEQIGVIQDDDVRRQVAEERADGDHEDLLSDSRPIE